MYLTGKRLEEELSLLKKEMVQYLCYYKDNLIPNLSSRLNSLNKGKRKFIYADFTLFSAIYIGIYSIYTTFTG